MGVDTIGYLNKEVTMLDIYNVVLSKFDNQATMQESSFSPIDCGIISFRYNNLNRHLSYLITSDRVLETEYENGEEHVNIILNHYDESIAIIKGILQAFGGYIDENDCDSEEAYYIPKDGDFEYAAFIEERDKIVEVLSKELNLAQKNKIANEILKHKDELKKLL